MSFRSEAEMSERLRTSLHAEVEAAGITWLPEVDGDVGVPDYLVVKTTDSAISYVVALELKLRDWRRGLVQAFRYRNFANEVYLVLDRHYLNPALANAERFTRSGVGLASLDVDGKFQIHVPSLPRTPFSAFLTSRVVSRLLMAWARSDEHRPALRFTKTTAGRRGFRQLRVVAEAFSGVPHDFTQL